MSRKLLRRRSNITSHRIKSQMKSLAASIIMEPNLEFFFGKHATVMTL